ncbi:MAG: 3'-5' exonuclease, partial [Actinomycetes bacterium]
KNIGATDDTTSKGLEFEAVFLAGVEENLIPHRMSFLVPGGLNEERRLFYVGITRARKKLHISLALTRTTFGESDSATPSRFLQEIPANLIDWRDSGAQASVYRPSIADQIAARASGEQIEYRKPTKKWDGAITQVRNNEGLQLEVGNLIEHVEFGRGRVVSVSGEGARQTAEINFGGAGKKRLLVKVAPITMVNE